MKRTRALGGVVGPVAFVTAWVVGATTTLGYSMVDDAISRLAAVGADSRSLMSAGFVAFGIAVPVYATALRAAVPGPSWIAATGAGIATLAVAALPLDRSESIDRLHGIAAGIGYVALALTPALAVRPLLRSGRRRLALAGVGAAAVSAVALSLSLVGNAAGLLQRIGLTASDLWLIASVPVVRSILDGADPAATAT